MKKITLFLFLLLLNSCSCSNDNDSYKTDIDIDNLYGTWIYENIEYTLTNIPYIDDYCILTISNSKQKYMYTVYKRDNKRQVLLFIHSIHGYESLTFSIIYLDNKNCILKEFKGDNKQYKLRKK